MKIRNLFNPLSWGKKVITETVTFVQYLMSLKGGKIDFYTDWVYAGISKIASSLARVEWELYQVDKKGDVTEVADSHPLLGLLYGFNPRTTRYEAMAKTVLLFLTDGEVGWYAGERAGGKPKALYVVPKSAYKIASKDAYGYPISYTLTLADNQKKEVPITDLLIIRNANPFGNDKGFSVLDALKDVAETDWYIGQWNKNLMKNDGSPSGIIEVPSSLTAKEAEILKKEVQSTMGGYENAHKLTVLMNGAKLNSTAFNPKDLDFNNGRAFNRDLLLAIIGTPKTLLGLDNGITKATAETAERVFAKYTLEPILQQVSEWLNEFLVPDFGANLWLSFEPLAQEDREQKLNEVNLGVNRWLTINEAREEYGKDPVTGGDYIYMPLMNVPMVGGAPKTAKEMDGLVIKFKSKGNLSGIKGARARLIKHRIQSRNAFKDFAGKQVEEAVGRNLSKKLAGKNAVVRLSVGKKKEFKSLEQAQKDAMWGAHTAIKSSVAGHLGGIFASIFEKQKQVILANLKREGEKSADPKFKVKASDVLFDPMAETQATVAIIEPQYYNIVTEGLKMAGEIAGAEALTVDQIPALMEWITKVADKYGTDVTQTTYDQLATILQQGLDEGLSIYDLGNKVEDYFGTVAPQRADMIARTESARAMTASEAYAWESYGFKKLEWYLAGGDPCEICTGNSVKEWSVEQAIKGIVNYSHPNCECIFLPL